MNMGMKKNQGFTFIELLMVFALISILSLMVLPALHKMKQKGRETTCIGNQRQLAVAAILYANEAMSKLPVSLVQVIDEGHLLNNEFQMAPSYEPAAYAQFATMPVFYNNNYALTHCPEVEGSVLDSTPTYSYGINVYVTGMRLENIESAATTVMLTDSHFEGVSSSTEVAFRHGDHAAIAAYVDGHIEIFDDIVPPTKFTPQNDEDEEMPLDDPVTEEEQQDDPSGPVVHSYPPVVDPNGFEIILITSSDEDGTSVSIDLGSTDDTDRALSHVSYTFNIELPHEVLQIIADSASSTMGYPVEVVDPDPQTGLRGIKFDETALGEDGVIESCNFTFTIPPDNYEDMESVSVTTKAGTGIETTTITFTK